VFRLLDLPPELQLYIYELAVTYDRPVQINFPCSAGSQSANSGYNEDANNVAWTTWLAEGRYQRLQPPLSQTRRVARHDILKIYYAHNVFEAGYCNDERREAACTWLRVIGPDNRRQMMNFFVSDTSNDLDEDCPEELAALSTEVAAPGGVVSRVAVEKGVRHRVTFPAADSDSAETEVAGGA